MINNTTASLGAVDSSRHDRNSKRGGKGSLVGPHYDSKDDDDSEDSVKEVSRPPQRASNKQAARSRKKTTATDASSSSSSQGVAALVDGVDSDGTNLLFIMNNCNLYHQQCMM